MKSKMLAVRLAALIVSIPMSVGAAEPEKGTSPAGVTEARLQQAIELADRMAADQIAKNNGVGIAIAVVSKDKVVHARGFGLREAGKPETVDENTVFQLASVSKPVGATVVASLIGDGDITWDSKISDLDPSFEMYDSWVTRQVTLRDLYAHRSGLPDHAGDKLEDIGGDRALVLHRLRYQRPDSSFRSAYAYTNFGLTAAAVAAAKANGLTWEQASEEKLYKPIGMTSTSSRFSDFMARQNKALGHVMVDGKWVHKDQRQPDAQSPAGGASSSVKDMTQWLRLELGNGKLDGKQYVAEAPLVETRKPHMFTMYSPFDQIPQFYGLGMNVSYDDHGYLKLSHSGGFDMGAATCISMIPKEQLGIVVLTNTSPIGVPEAITASFMNVALYGKVEQDWLPIYRNVFDHMLEAHGFDYAKAPAKVLPPMANESYVGTYTNDFYGDLIIAQKNGALVMMQGPHKMEFATKHYDRDIFVYQPTGENAGRVWSGIRFDMGPDGKATSLVVEHFDEDGQGRFERRK
jgi:CubicO group peptidase (beta-lactamase class C family)